MQNKNLKLKIFFLTIIFGGVFGMAGRAFGAIQYVDDCSPSGVGAAHSVAADGDVIYLRCNISGDEVIWTSDVTITKHITIQGKGSSITKISWESGAHEGTPENGRIKLRPTTNPLSPYEMRVTGIHFYSPDPFSSGGGYQTSIHIYGIAAGLKRVRIDNCKFTNGNHNILFSNYAYGLVDNNTFLDTNIPILITGDEAAAWARAIEPGTGNAVYFENNTYTVNNQDNCAVTDAVVYCGGSCRQVIRYNTFNWGCVTGYIPTATSITNDHGFNGSSGLSRGTIMTEAYNNTINCVETGGLFGVRGGTQLLHDNSLSCSGRPDYCILTRFTDEESWTSGGHFCPAGASPEPYDNCPVVTNWPSDDGVNNSFVWGNKVNGNDYNTVIRSHTTINGEGYDDIVIAPGEAYWETEPAFSGQGYTYWGAGIPSNGRLPAGAKGLKESAHWSAGTSAWYPYISYTYPHPLRDEGVDTTPPNVPSGLTVN